MTTDIIIVSFNTRDLLRACLASVARHAALPSVRTIVVDNASTDGSPDMVRREFPEATLITLDENLGFGAANNRGIEAGDGGLLLFLNPDAELTEGAFETLVEYLEANPRCVIAGPKLTNPDGSFQPSCRRFPSFLRNIWCFSGMGARFPKRFRILQSWLNETEHRPGLKVDMVSGACFLARRDYLASIGNFDEHQFLYEEEMDISLPARAQALEVRYCRDAVVIHHGGASIQPETRSAFATHHLFRSKYYCFRKHYGLFTARATYWADCTLFGISGLVRWLRGHSADGIPVAWCRRAWRKSSPSDTNRASV